MTLTEFLLARISEDEDAALRVRTVKWDALAFHDEAEDDIPHIVRHSPDHVLAECAAKRYVVGSADLIYTRRNGSLDSVASAVNARLMLAAMADVYADHPDYQQEWKP